MSGKLIEELKVTHYIHDPADATVLTDVAWVDMRDYTSLLATVLATSLTGAGVTVFKILGNAASDGSGTDVVVKTHAIGSAPDADGDYLVLEATKDEIVAAGQDAGIDVRYASVQLDCAHANDIAAVTYIRRGKVAQSGQTADVVA